MNNVQTHFVNGVEGAHIVPGSHVDLVLEYDRVTPQIAARYGMIAQTLESSGGSLTIYPAGAKVEKRKELEHESTPVEKAAGRRSRKRRLVPDVSAEAESGD